MLWFSVWVLVAAEAATAAFVATDGATSESGDWFTFGGVLVRGVLNAPVDWRWRSSKISCSSFGRRGGAGPCVMNGFLEPEGEDPSSREALRGDEVEMWDFCIDTDVDIRDVERESDGDVDDVRYDEATRLCRCRLVVVRMR